MEALAAQQYRTSTDSTTQVSHIPVTQTPLSHHPHTILQNAFNDVFTSNSDLDSNIARIRRILGATAITLSDEQIETIISEFQFLIGTWMDEFEKDLFKGMTLQEVINNT